MKLTILIIWQHYFQWNLEISIYTPNYYKSPPCLNPIVYSRNGKDSYKSNSNTKMKTMFQIEDLQKIISTNCQTPSGKAGFKWDFKEKCEPYYCPDNDKDKTLLFESRFESGNLDLAIKITDNSYWLVLQNDSLTKGNTQCITV